MAPLPAVVVDRHDVAAVVLALELGGLVGGPGALGEVAAVEQRARAWIVSVETGYKDRVRAAAEQFKAENSAILSRLEAMEKQLQGRGGAGGTVPGAVPLGDSNSKLKSPA